MDKRIFYAGPNDENRRIDKILRVFLPDMSLTEIYKALRKGLIKVNNKKIDCNHRVHDKDEISIPVFMLDSVKNSDINITKIDLKKSLPQIIFENENIIIFNKPYDLLVQGNIESLDKITIEYYKENFPDNSLAFSPGPLHRLDRKTTGLIAFSKSIDGARWFSENIKNHTIQKKYKTILEGEIKEKEIWEDFIEKEESQQEAFYKVKSSFQKKSDKAKNAYTEVYPLKIISFNNKILTVAEVLIKTGRTHQIRAQASLHNHPLLGDTAYGGTKLNKNITSKDFFLHAYKLQIPSNPIGLPEEISSDLPEDFYKFITETCDMKISGV